MYTDFIIRSFHSMESGSQPQVEQEEEEVAGLWSASIWDRNELMTLQSIPFHLILDLDSLDSFEKGWNAAPNSPNSPNNLRRYIVTFPSPYSVRNVDPAWAAPEYPSASTRGGTSQSGQPSHIASLTSRPGRLSVSVRVHTTTPHTHTHTTTTGRGPLLKESGLLTIAMSEKTVSEPSAAEPAEMPRRSSPRRVVAVLLAVLFLSTLLHPATRARHPACRAYARFRHQTVEERVRNILAETPLIGWLHSFPFPSLAVPPTLTGGTQRRAR